MKDIIEIQKDVYWLGSLHPDLRIFDDLFPTKNGTTYNSFLIKGEEKTAVIDTVKGKFTAEFLDKVKRLTDPAKIDYIIINHTEPDHSGALAALLEICPNAVVCSSQAAANFLGNLVQTPFSGRVVREGEVLDLGGKHLRFIMAPFLHWPDTMFTYLEENRVLFTCDAFGAHYCGTGIFNDELPDVTGDMEFYYDSLMRPFKDKVLSAVNKISGMSIDMICPSHGPVLRKNPMRTVELYGRWSRPPADGCKIPIFYLSPHGNTGKMSEAVAHGASLPGVEILRRHINRVTADEIRDLMEEADAVIFGIPTINRDIPKPMWEVMAYLSSVNLKTTLGGVFGSYGWSGEACRMAEDRLKGLRFTFPAPYVRSPFAPKTEELAQCEALGRSVAEAVLRKKS